MPNSVFGGGMTLSMLSLLFVLSVAAAFAAGLNLGQMWEEEKHLPRAESRFVIP